MRHVLSIAAFGLATVVFCSVTSAQNLLTNGGFDLQPGAGEAPVSWVVRGGFGGVYADPAGNGSNTPPNYMQINAFAEIGQITSHTLVQGETLHFTAYGRAFGSTSQYDVRLYANTNPSDISSGNILSHLIMDPNSQVMTLYSADYTVTAADAGKLLAAYIATGGTGTDGVDGISVTTNAVPEPASLGTLAVIGAAALGRRRRRV